MHRRDFLKAIAASLVVYHPATSLLAKERKSAPKIVWVVLRGALDSLHTVVPTFDQHLSSLRPTLYKSIKDKCLPLDKGFALHPSLANCHHWYQSQQLLPIVAVSSGYQKRSHFDGQDYLESGLITPDLDSGWLARAIAAKQKEAIAISPSTPISLRGTNSNSRTWYPSRLPEAKQNIYESLQTLYEDSPHLLKRLNEGLEMEALLDENKMQSKQKGNFVALSRSCGKLLAQDEIDCAMLTLNGWDTHSGQAGRLKRQLSNLDNGLAALKSALADKWQNTLVIVATEFGRTAKENGTRGTDHGTASALFLAGGNINGGQVLGKWPGLAKEQLHQQRDLAATSNSFEWIAGALQQHWQLSEQQVKTVFPDRDVFKGELFRR